MQCLGREGPTTWPGPAEALRSLFAAMFCAMMLIVVAGCVSSERSLDETARSAVRHIAIRPVEPPPLVVPTAFAESLSSAGELELLQELGFLIGALLIVAPTSEETRDRLAQYEAYATALDSDDAWLPTRVLARETEVALLESGGIRVEQASPVRRLYAGDKRERLDPYGEVRSWYNAEESPSVGFVTEADAVLEVGLLNFEFFTYPGHAQPTFIVQVMMRLVDARSGAVLARARAFNDRLVPDLHQLFADDAKVFKAIFADMTAPLVRLSLTEMGLR
jgi:hypothetical protein